ncbi:hypothetical protein ACIGB8_10540 [Promicromonospora sukumoe]|uniref:hypothetical protein n=1 Tax=Promicromonospora sukumoe TaxID=88382 RepID=UPI0037CB5DD3
MDGGLRFEIPAPTGLSTQAALHLPSAWSRTTAILGAGILAAESDQPWYDERVTPLSNRALRGSGLLLIGPSPHLESIAARQGGLYRRGLKGQYDLGRSPQITEVLETGVAMPVPAHELVDFVENQLFAVRRFQYGSPNILELNVPEILDRIGTAIRTLLHPARYFKRIGLEEDARAEEARERIARARYSREALESLPQRLTDREQTALRVAIALRAVSPDAGNSAEIAAILTTDEENSRATATTLYSRPKVTELERLDDETLFAPPG